MDKESWHVTGLILFLFFLILKIILTFLLFIWLYSVLVAARRI